MGNFRRVWLNGGVFFFTVVTNKRQPFLMRPDSILALRASLRAVKDKHPFEILAWVTLPDHIHTLWQLPEDDCAYDLRWRLIKAAFTHRMADTLGAERFADRRRQVWQPKYWEHTIRDETDFNRHFDYIHFNPVRHGLVAEPKDWPYSSFHRAVRLGHYPENWAKDPKINIPE